MFTDNIFREEYKFTTYIEFFSKRIELNGKIIKIKIWDTAGDENFHKITNTYYKGVIGVLLVYDITRKETFSHITKWLEEIKFNSYKYLFQ